LPAVAGATAPFYSTTSGNRAQAVLATCEIQLDLEIFGAFMYSIPVQVVLMPKRTTYTQARAHLAKICDEVAETREPYIIERRSAENVAMISEDELESLTETAHLLRSPANVRRLLTALERALASQLEPTSVEDLRRELDLGEEE
jgi:antitoxin YefM